MAYIATEVVIDIETGRVLRHTGYDYCGPIALCKGGLEKAQQDAEALRQQQINLQQQMLNIFQQQMGGVNAVLDPLIAQGGMGEGQRAALTSLAMNTLPNTFNSLYGALQNRLTQRGVAGGMMAGGGDIARQFGALGAEQARQQSQLLSSIPDLAHTQLMQELGMKLGIGGQFGGQAQGFNQGALGAMGIQQRAAEANALASTGLWGSLFGALGQVGGAAMGR